MYVCVYTPLLDTIGYVFATLHEFAMPQRPRDSGTPLNRCCLMQQDFDGTMRAAYSQIISS